MPNTSGPLVVALVYDGLCTFEFGIVAEIFGLSRPEMGEGWYRYASCAIEPGPLRAHGGFLIQTEDNSHLIDEADLIIAPGWKGAGVPVPEELVTRLKAAHARGAKLASICSGAFVLAATGLLNGGVAATHWRYAEALGKAHPDIEVDAASLYREHGRLFTSAGSAAGIDLMIEIVRRDFGPDAANSVARRLVMPAHRSGGQAQFLERPVARREGAEIAPLLDAIRADPASAWTISRMAGFCRMSERTFLRRFRDATGLAPGDWIASERVEQAKERLIRGQESVDEIAIALGFGGGHTLRHHFRRRLGVSPADYRARFSVSA